MSQALSNLVSLLALEKIEENLFRGRSEDLGFRQLFGGQVLGQALSAASQTVAPERPVHSVHGYFLRPGDAQLPIVYQVESPRDGGSFTTRTVSAIQKGRAIFTLMASFHADERGVSHQTPMPEVVGPEGLKNELEMALEYQHKLPEAVHNSMLNPKPIEIRRVNRYNPLKPEPARPQQYIWFRADGPLPEDDHLHRYLFAYASDFNLLSTAALPHGISSLLPNIQMASLDHAVWFHRPLRMNDWLLYAMDSPSASGARGFSRGLVYNRAGELVASVAQESLMRKRSDKN